MEVLHLSFASGVVDVREGWGGGPAKAAYEGQSGTFLAAVREGTGQLREGADRLDEVAAKIEEAQNRYRQAMAAAGVTLGVGIALTVFTFGGSDAAAAALVSAEARQDETGAGRRGGPRGPSHPFP